MNLTHAIYILFLFALGSCVGSFLNVVVWRLPRVEPVEGEGTFRSFLRSMNALSEPPSHCPKCRRMLKWYDNIPVIGWLKLGGKCRFCKMAISPRYPIVEAITGLLFAFYYYAFFVLQVGPCLFHNGQSMHRTLYVFDHWWVYGMDMAMLSGLLAASLIDAELFIIPMEIPWLLALLGLGVHCIFDRPDLAGNVIVDAIPAAIALGGGIGLAISILLLDRGVLKMSFAEGGPEREIDRDRPASAAAASAAGISAGTKAAAGATATIAPAPAKEWSAREVRQEMRKEMAFLLPPLFLGLLFGLLAWRVEAIARVWEPLVRQLWVGALLGSLLGALVGGFIVWLTRILGTLAFGREAMGMGDVDLMFGVGAVVGAGPAVAAFFLAPFLGMVVAIYMLLTGSKRELPYGPYLSLATAVVLLFYCPIADYFLPGLLNVAWMARHLMGAGE